MARALLHEDVSAPVQPSQLYLQGLLLRIGTSLVMWTFCLAAFLAGIIHRYNFIGVSAACGSIIALCMPFFFVLRSLFSRRFASVALTVDRLLTILGFTGVIYSLGGIEATYLTPIYAVFTMYIGVVSVWRRPFITAAIAISCFSLMVVSEHFGIIPHFNVNQDFQLPFKDQVSILGVTAGLQLVSAFVASYAARLIERGRERLRVQNAELERTTERALKSDRLKSEFLANMSHEVRTPLNHIIGFTELVLEDARDRLNETNRESLGDVLQSARHLLSLINDILDTAKVEAGEIALTRAAVDLPALLEQSLNIVKDSAHREGIELVTEIGDIPSRAWVDERRLKQVLFNLLSNAVKFTQRGGRVVLSARTSDAQGPADATADDSAQRFVAISISDTGIGVRRDDLERLFVPFGRLEDRQGARFPGTGLGLSLARRLVELHGGRIWADSAGESKGTTFHFTIRLASPPQRDAPSD